MPTTETTMQWLSILMETAPAAILQLVAYLRERGHEQTATDIEAHLANSDANFKLLINNAREAQGLPPLP
jgi:hypothetical protein